MALVALLLACGSARADFPALAELQTVAGPEAVSACMDAESCYDQAVRSSNEILGLGFTPANATRLCAGATSDNVTCCVRRTRRAWGDFGGLGLTQEQAAALCARQRWCEEPGWCVERSMRSTYEGGRGLDKDEAIALCGAP